MAIEIGQVEAIYRYPVKSMAGERVETCNVGWTGLDGDRRLALRRVNEPGGFPWLSASKLPEMLRFTPLRREAGAMPTHVRTPEGNELAIFGAELTAEITGRCGRPVEMMHLKAGIFDDATVSVLTTDSVQELGRLSGTEPDVRRFRPNILVALAEPNSFGEDRWVGGILLFGTAAEGPRISVTTRDIRCSMVNLDPDTARSSPEVMKAIARVNESCAGVYGAVIRTGVLEAGQKIWWHPGVEGELRAGRVDRPQVRARDHKPAGK